MSAGQSAKGHDFLRTFRGKKTNSPWKTPNEHLTSFQGTKFMSRRSQKKHAKLKFYKSDHRNNQML